MKNSLKYVTIAIQLQLLLCKSCLVQDGYNGARIAIMFKIADFVMARDVANDTYYITSGGKIPLKWTAPKVWFTCGVV